MSQWTRGQHVLLVGSTGTGKTTLARKLVELRAYTIMLQSKPDDLSYPRWREVKTCSKIRIPKDDENESRWRLYPKYEDQREEFIKVLRRAWSEGGWCIYLDELFYLEDYLGLRSEIVKLLSQGRSKAISVVAAIQRPAWVNRFSLSEITHILCARMGDTRDLKTIQEVTSAEYVARVPKLEKYQFLYMDKGKGSIETVNKDTVQEVLGG